MNSITYYKLNLANISDNLRGKIGSKIVPWIYSNDYGFEKIIPALKIKSKKLFTGKRIKIGLFVGVGSLFNVAPWVDVDFFLMIDRNGFVLDRVKEMVEGIKQADLPSEYEAYVESADYFNTMEGMHIDVKNYWLAEHKSFGKKHFLASIQNYKRTRLTLTTRPVLYVQGDLSFESFVEALSSALNNTVISYMNISDLGEWSQKALDLLPRLPISHDVLISWSTNQNHDGIPIAKLTQGYDHFLKDAKTTSYGLSVNYFRRFE